MLSPDADAGRGQSALSATPHLHDSKNQALAYLGFYATASYQSSQVILMYDQPCGLSIPRT